jgi:hypothetical protein
MSRHFNIGIDFGTSQTKVCIQQMGIQPPVHTFVAFPSDRGDSLFLPSVVLLQPDGTLRFGHKTNEREKAYSYFKIASAEDIEFRVLSGHSVEEEHYSARSFAPFTPELLAVFYLAHVILRSDAFVENLSRPSRPIGGFLARAQTVETMTTKSLQIGIPTEYSSHVSYLRRRKFETILYLAKDLAKHVGNVGTLEQSDWKDLRARVQEANNAILKSVESGDAMDAILNGQRLSVFPESAAGLTTLVHRRTLAAGFYAALDIGGGSSDISFFEVTRSNNISYLGSESTMLAANDVYRRYDLSGSVAENESRLRRLIVDRGTSILLDNQYKRAAGSVTREVYRLMYRSFNGQPARELAGRATSTIARALDKQPCFVYGGGASLPVDTSYLGIRIHDQGRRDLPDQDDRVSVLARTPLTDYATGSDRLIEPEGALSGASGSLLVVAMGLSFPQQDARRLWTDFHSGHDGTNGNPGAVVYDVTRRSWKDYAPRRELLASHAPSPVPVNDGLNIIPLSIQIRAKESSVLDRMHPTMCPHCAPGREIKWIVPHLLKKHGEGHLEGFLTQKDVTVSGERLDKLIANYCELCDTRFLNFGGLQVHLKSVHPIKKCPGCRKNTRLAANSSLCPDCETFRWQRLDGHTRRHSQRRRR